MNSLKMNRINTGQYETHHKGYRVIVQKAADVNGKATDWRLIIPRHGLDTFGFDALSEPAFFIHTNTKREAVETAAWWIDNYGDEFASEGCK